MLALPIQEAPLIARSQRGANELCFRAFLNLAVSLTRTFSTLWLGRALGTISHTTPRMLLFIQQTFDIWPWPRTPLLLSVFLSLEEADRVTSQRTRTRPKHH
jgi:hypothetical protein